MNDDICNDARRKKRRLGETPQINTRKYQRALNRIQGAAKCKVQAFFAGERPRTWKIITNRARSIWENLGG